MISYRTLLFGTIAVVAAAAPAVPALADSAHALPLAIVRAPQDSAHALPLSRTSGGATLNVGNTNTFVQSFLQFEGMLLRISL